MVALGVMLFGMFGCFIASAMLNFILLLTFVEIASVAMFFVLILSLVPAYFPERIKVDSVFYCGLGKEPYINDASIYRPNVPLLNTPFDPNWDQYYDRSAIKVKEK